MRGAEFRSARGNALTRAGGAGSPAIERERRIVSGAERDILTLGAEDPGYSAAL